MLDNTAAFWIGSPVGLQITNVNACEFLSIRIDDTLSNTEYCSRCMLCVLQRFLLNQRTTIVHLPLYNIPDMIPVTTEFLFIYQTL